jgi:hypothetical protein
MKKLIIGMLVLCSMKAFAAESISGEKMADLLSSSKAAPCLANLYQLENEAELRANSYGFVVVKDETKQEIQTTIEYRIVKGGDMIAGEAKIIVTEKLYQIPEAPQGITAPKVEGCKFDSRLQF